MTIQAIQTRFRAYQLGSAGASFSYFSGDKFVLIEARYTETNAASIEAEMRACGVETISTLHITSWDQDHCSPSQLEEIIERFSPKKIQYPGYVPHTSSGKSSLAIIEAYKTQATKPRVVGITPEYIERLDEAPSYGYRDILYWPKEIDPDNANNNSTVKQFRSGSFNVLSLGDVESTNISSFMRRCRTVNSEVDVMIMAHHGADNGFTTSAFLKNVRPTLAIATSNYSNQFDHPKPKIRELLHKNKVRLFTTKTGDVIVRSTGNHTGQYEVINLKAGSTEVSSQYVGSARKAEYLRSNQDSLRDRRARNNRGPRH